MREGERVIPLLNGNVGETVDVKCAIKTISFSAHSDFPGTSSFVKDTQPDYVVLVHGETSRMEDLKTGLLEVMQEFVKFNGVWDLTCIECRCIVQVMEMNCVSISKHQSIFEWLEMQLLLNITQNP